MCGLGPLKGEAGAWASAAHGSSWHRPQRPSRGDRPRGHTASRAGHTETRPRHSWARGERSARPRTLSRAAALAAGGPPRPLPGLVRPRAGQQSACCWSRSACCPPCAAEHCTPGRVTKRLPSPPRWEGGRNGGAGPRPCAGRCPGQLRASVGRRAPSSRGRSSPSVNRGLHTVGHSPGSLHPLGGSRPAFLKHGVGQSRARRNTSRSVLGEGCVCVHTCARLSTRVRPRRKGDSPCDHSPNSLQRTDSTKWESEIRSLVQGHAGTASVLPGVRLGPRAEP